MFKETAELRTVVKIRNALIGTGWEEKKVSYTSLSVSEVKPGQVVTCMDPRRDGRTDPNLLGPAAAGGVLGLAYFLKGMNFTRRMDFGERLEIVLSKLEREGLQPGAHGDYEHGEIKGCKFSSALIKGYLPDDHIQEEELQRLIFANGIYQHMFSGTGDPQGLVLNYREGTTIIPQRKKYVLDTWLIDALGIEPEAYTNTLDFTGKMLLPRERRILIIPY